MLEHNCVLFIVHNCVFLCFTEKAVAMVKEEYSEGEQDGEVVPATLI